MSGNDLASLQKQAESKMKSAIEHLMTDFKAIRTGRANVSVLDPVMVDSYGQKMPINQLASLSTPDSQLIVIDPWDKSQIEAIEKAIEIADLGLNPSNDGAVIRVPIPPLTEERRKEIIKKAKKKSEDYKVSIRNIRRDINEHIKKVQKDGHVSEDDVKYYLEEIQILTDKYVKEIDTVFHKKEKDILEV